MKQRVRRLASSTTARLATTYLVIIMLMSIGFSIVLYNTSLHALNRQVPPNDSQFRTVPRQDTQPDNTQIHDFLQQRAAEGRQALMIRLIVLNTVALVAGGGLSYYLARRSLKPIEAVMEAQAQFVSDASHELRTPLTAIRTMNDVTLRDPKLTLTTAKQVIRDNTAEAIKLKLLSDGLLDLAQQHSTPPKLQPVAVQSAVTSAINQVMTIAQQKHIAIDDQTANVTVLSNEAVLSQVLVILLDNAIKYSDTTTTICLTTSLKSNYILVSVQDQGVGIRASDIPHLFRRFYRADAARSGGQHQGYGLGLAIADNLVRAHDASLSVQSKLGHGSTFTIKLRTATTKQA